MPDDNIKQSSDGSTPTRRNMLRAAAGVGTGAVIIPSVAAASPGGEEIGGFELDDIDDFIPIDLPFPLNIGFTAYEDPCAFELELSALDQTRTDSWTCDPDGESCEEVTLNLGLRKVEAKTCYDSGYPGGPRAENELTYCTRTYPWQSWDCDTYDLGSEDI
ncbi:hypothetical protein [Halostagnicola bangensis]